MRTRLRAMRDRYAEAARGIPRGRTRTYAELAVAAGRPGSARAAGRSIAKAASADDRGVPWHRVIAAGGLLPRDDERARVQLRRLRREKARPRAQESVAAWARRTGVPYVGHYGRRVYAPAGDARVASWPALRVEPLADEAEARARGFRAIDAPAEEGSTAPWPAPRGGTRARANPQRLERALADVDWASAHDDIAREGFTKLAHLLATADCEAILRASTERERFERTVEMDPRGFGVGAYHYYREPLPEPASTLRARLYEHLQPLANELVSPGAPEKRRGTYPATLAEFWARCRRAGQTRGSSILLCYGEAGVNHPHRDLYGPEWFPVQVMVPLSRKGRDFEGGALVLLEEAEQRDVRRPIDVDQGDVILFVSRARRSREGRQVPVRHGMDPVTRGQRFALGIVFHLAK